MKICFFIITILLSGILSGFAQEAQTPTATSRFFEKLMQPDTETGSKIAIFQDSRIERLFESMRTGIYKTASASGFRVQVYSSNAHKTAKDEAYRIEKDMKAAFPEHAVYVTYSSPFWKVRLGDFKTNTEADAFRHLLLNEFPALKSAAYVVKDQIKI